MEKWYSVKAFSESQAPRSAELYIYGDIGDKWDEHGVTAAELVSELGTLDVDQIKLRINSYGGSVPDGLAIYNALRRHKAAIDVQVDGVAVSCAGYIAMAGDTITMAENAMLMIHAPWGAAIGNAAALREQADVLDKYAAAMSTSYSKKSGKPEAECLALLSDGKDHWYTAAEAKAEGFCDLVGPAVEVAASLSKTFDLSRFKKPVASATNKQESKTMPDGNVPTQDVKAAPFARDKAMNEQILAMFKPFASRDEVANLQTEILADPALTVETAQAKLLAKLGEGAAPVAAPVNIEMGESESDKMRDAAVQAILARAGVRDAKGEAIRADGSNPFRGYRLTEFAKASLERGGVKTRGMDQMQVVAAAFTQSTSDFPVLLENVMHKTLQAAYAVAANTWSRFCATGTVSDFRAHPRYRLGSLSNLDAVNELSEFKNKAISDGEKSTITATTKGNIINISRQAVINDDLGAFVGLAATLGRASARTVEADVYTYLGQNGGLGPNMTDGNPLFHASHNNIATTGALTSTVVDDMRVKLASQTGVGSIDYLDLRPAVFLCPMGSGSTARVINDAQYDPDTANKLQKPNIVRGLFRDIVDTPRLSGTRVYMFADPGDAQVIEVAFLDGNQSPYLEVQDGFDVDGARYKVRLDFGIAAIDYRGAVTAAGA